MLVYQIFLISLFLLHQTYTSQAEPSSPFFFATAHGQLCFQTIIQYFDFHCSLAESGIKNIPRNLSLPQLVWAA